MSAASGCVLCERAAGRAEADVVAVLDECVVVLHGEQRCRGWCVLILKEHAEHLGELSAERQGRVWDEVRRVAGAIRGVYPGVRINYGCLGNQVHHVHWHVVPRHGDDPRPMDPPWGWPAEVARGEMTAGEKRELIGRLGAELGRW